jgi:hypothetical protein
MDSHSGSVVNFGQGIFDLIGNTVLPGVSVLITRKSKNHMTWIFIGEWLIVDVSVADIVVAFEVISICPLDVYISRIISNYLMAQLIKDKEKTLCFRVNN